METHTVLRELYTLGNKYDLEMKGTETYEVKRNIQIITFLQAEGRVRILFSMYAHYFLYKKKYDSEGRTRSLEFGIKNHGDLLPGLQAESKNC